MFSTFNTANNVASNLFGIGWYIAKELAYAGLEKIWEEKNNPFFWFLIGSRLLI
jgi:hypothetical protein